MKNHSPRYIIITAILIALVALLVGTALAQDSETIVITGPTEGETVSDIITITGAADFPDFLKYDLFLKNGGNMIYFATGYSPVINGNLALLDTKTLPDGSYQLVLRAVTSDSNYIDHPGPVFTIENNLGAPLAHPEVQQSLLYPPLSGLSLLRIQNCGGFNLEFDYTSPEGFCSHDNLWIMGKAQDQTLCVTVDALVEPCEYRGTASPEDGQGKNALTYSFVAEPGKIYEIIYPGERFLWINEVPGDERAESDTGGLDPMHPDRFQSIEDIKASTADMSMQAPKAEMSAGEMSVSKTTETTQITIAKDDETGQDAVAVTQEEKTVTVQTTDSVLPESGAALSSKMPFAAAAGVLIVFMVVGGVVAMRKDKQSS